MAATFRPSFVGWTVYVVRGVARKIYVKVPENLWLHNKILDRMGSKLGGVPSIYTFGEVPGLLRSPRMLRGWRTFHVLSSTPSARILIPGGRVVAVAFSEVAGIIAADTDFYRKP